MKQSFETVLNYFQQICVIPHGSGNTAGIRQWCLDTANALGLDAYADEPGNVIIRKPASAGYEAHPGVILQGHMDMVCAKLPDCPKNMETEGLDLIRDDAAGILYADGTTLGADDGVAVAYAFAVLADNTLPHPKLTVIITVDEETGMDGATGLAPAELTGQYLINIDSEEEGVLTVGCAGGVRNHLHFPCETAEVTGTAVRFTVSGLTGGHSGAEIHKPLLNANLAALEILRAVKTPFSLAAFSGGVRDNVIPTECSAELITNSGDTVREEIEAAFAALKRNNPQETGMALAVSQTEGYTCTALTADAAAKLLDTLSVLPNGVQQMNEALGMPQTSLNLGVFSLNGGEMQVDALVRSGVNAEKYVLADTLKAIAENAGGTAERSGDYAAWEYKPGTALERTAAEVFAAQYGKVPEIVTIHAGLECGILSAKAPQLECISIGPDIPDIHTPRERLPLDSAERTWEYLLALLKAL